MNTTIHELLAFNEWADAEHYRALAHCPEAAADQVIHDRLHHYHLTQHAFLWVVSKSDFTRTRASDFNGLDALKKYAWDFHTKIRAYIERTPDEELQVTVRIPWFKESPIVITKEQALLQAVMHTLGHRAQNASRLRALGGEPPTTDWIAWLLKEKPDAAWDS